jgi:hypothetical protein
MSSLIVANNPPSLQLLQMPEESLIHIFGFLDLEHLGMVASVCKWFQQLQDERSLWHSLFPPLEFYYRDFYKHKRLTKSSLRSLGSQKLFNHCILDLCLKMIMLIQPSDDAKSSCLLAIQHREVPNGSFVVYIAKNNQQEGEVAGAVIKNQHGIISVVDDVQQPNDDPVIRDATARKAVEYIRWYNSETEYGWQEYTLLSTQDDPDDTFYSKLREASKQLRATTSDFDGPFRLGKHKLVAPMNLSQYS